MEKAGGNKALQRYVIDDGVMIIVPWGPTFIG